MLPSKRQLSDEESTSKRVKHTSNDSGSNPSEPAGVVEENAGAEDKIPKRYVIIQFGYSGENYQGLQINDGAITVEKILEQAIYEAGGLIISNRDFAKNHWTRACRTDKGVHAACNVVSLKMNFIEDMKQKINAHLPSDIRVFRCLRGMRLFSGHRFCSERLYQYILPSYCFQPAYWAFFLLF